ncbi:methylmalonyl Co-A mutase-associated GTPase MeaB [Saprospira sp. CCB-QB6]|uniref:methylmalonyl Co-A mutase-associated GTPase MeaB n=1 Tax=Saprospira sp. CCB-QB6 TaxID=3023936 RepID=UPI00234BBEA7|nr:methylmalonyl Co-A mutase-associated GTPase MeaB [Saprospira sp. CCB-QB6]WCL80344.1 methylmalonyl Co-A mutase-associated GTPase MeaB [Saprospira sp. CCB-QB6]
MENNKDKKSALHIAKGITETPTFKKKQLARFKRRKPSVEELLQGILAQDRLLLSQAITLVESQKPTDRLKADQLIEACLQQNKSSLRLGITGSPGVGKSTFIESFGQMLIQKGFRPAVLAIDPSSQRTGGSILGDKTRMQTLSSHPQAFVRPSPAGDALGGVARKTREAIFLCETAGFSPIIVETVGVGQSELAVHSMVDFFMLLLLPNAGDELQGIKRGVVEMADLLLVNKADGEALQAAKRSKQQYRNALHLFPAQKSGWTPKVSLASGLHAEGLENIWEQIQDYCLLTQENTYWKQRRAEQAEYWMRQSIEQELLRHFYEHPKVQAQWPGWQAAVRGGQTSSFRAARELLKLVQKED